MPKTLEDKKEHRSTGNIRLYPGDIVWIDLDTEAVRPEFTTELINLFARESRKLVRLHVDQGEQSEAKSNHSDFVKIRVRVGIIIAHYRPHHTKTSNN